MKAKVTAIRKLFYIGLAIREYEVKQEQDPDFFKTSNDKKLWIINRACQYSSNPKLKPEDFEGILDQPLINHL